MILKKNRLGQTVPSMAIYHLNRERKKIERIVYIAALPVARRSVTLNFEMKREAMVSRLKL